MPSTRQGRHAFPEIAYILWKRRWLIPGVVCAAVIITVAVSLFEKPAYEAEAVVIVQPREEPGFTYSSEDFLHSVVGAVVQEDLLKEVTKRAGWTSGTKEFEKRLYVEDFTGDNGRAGLRVRFVGTDAEGAARAANAYATLFVKKVEQLGERRLAGGSLAARAEIQQKAVPPDNKFSPHIVLRAVLAAIAGLLIGIVASLILESRTHGWRSIHDAEFILKIPVLGTIPHYSTDEKSEA